MPLRGEKVGERDGLALVDFLATDEVDGRGSLVDFEGLGVCGDDHVFGKRLNFQAKVERASFRGGEIENDVTWYKGRVLEVNVIAAWRNGEEIGAVSAGNRRPDLRACAVLKLSGDFDVADAVAGKIREFSGKTGIR